MCLLFDLRFYYTMVYRVYVVFDNIMTTRRQEGKVLDYIRLLKNIYLPSIYYPSRSKIPNFINYLAKTIDHIHFFSNIYGINSSIINIF